MTRQARLMAALAFAATVFGSLQASAQLAGDDRAKFIEGSFNACNDKATRNYPELGAATIKSYCHCMAEKEADITTQADIDYVGAHNEASDDYKSRIIALAPSCRALAGHIDRPTPEVIPSSPLTGGPTQR